MLQPTSLIQHTSIENQKQQYKFIVQTRDSQHVRKSEFQQQPKRHLKVQIVMHAYYVPDKQLQNVKVY